ncbi:hypothetical protein SAMN02910265_01573 [Ruminococcus flavefaciens]|uniref:Uncharacterized protein n=1 Tax=Ruminococcus flavefaciens TaxID=1265 RepID=A0A1H6JD54_RUMFL|nr:DUF6483 family protein [Ruminococcus flavefaciens]SEH57596.1 hypothetical protein SAMN02910265_01573 [Ruminococcus flavefaciens]
MFEQDYIMRQIKEMTAIIAKIMFGVNDRKSFYMLQEAERQKVYSLVTQVKNGEPKEAVLELDRLTDNNTKENMMIGLEFYAQLSDMDEEYFIKSGYSFGNLRDDFENFTKKFGMDQMTELYFGKDDDNE